MSPPIQLQRLPERRKKPAPKRALLFLVLLALFVCAGLAGCDARADSEQPLTKAELGAVKACSKGRVPVWSGPSEIECFKERL